MDNSYKKLDAYIMAKEIVRMVYDTTKQFPDEEKFVLCIKSEELRYPFLPILQKDYPELQLKSNAIF